jgi:hypothetical protein
MRVRSLAVAALGCLWLLPATASASHVQCGDTLTQETVLDSDIVCTAQDPAGLVIGGDDFKLNLNGYTIQGAGAADTDGIADDGTAHSGVTVKAGVITGFDDGIDLDLANGQIVKVAVTATSVGIALRGNGNYFHRNEVDMSTGSGFSGIEVLGDDTYLWRNTITGSPQISPDDGIVLHGNNPRVIYNFVDGCGFDGVVLDGYTDGIVARNDITHCDIGYNTSGTGLRLQTNVASGNCIGIVADDPAARVRWNTANDNCSEGIFVMQAGTTLFKNTANNNVDIGIDAPDGTIDLGENTATGNDVANCIGVVCVPPLLP